jgi:hypothetical protein
MLHATDAIIVGRPTAGLFQGRVQAEVGVSAAADVVDAPEDFERLRRLLELRSQQAADIVEPRLHLEDADQQVDEAVPVGAGPWERCFEARLGGPEPAATDVAPGFEIRASRGELEALGDAGESRERGFVAAAGRLADPQQVIDGAAQGARMRRRQGGQPPAGRLDPAGAELRLRPGHFMLHPPSRDARGQTPDQGPRRRQEHEPTPDSPPRHREPLAIRAGLLMKVNDGPYPEK